MKQGSHFKNNAVGFNQGNFEQNFRSGQTFNNGSDVNQNSFVVHQTNFDENVATDRSERTRNYQVTVELQRYAKDEQYETQKQQDNAKDEQYKKEEDYVMGLFAWRMIRAVVIFLYVGFRIADIYVIFSSFRELCGSTELSMSSAVILSQLASTTTSSTTQTYDSHYNSLYNLLENTTNEIPTTEPPMNATDLLHRVTSGMTTFTLLYEAMVAYGIMSTISSVVIGFFVLSIIGAKLDIDLTTCCCVCVVKGFTRMIRPLLFLDSLFLLILGPFGNVHFFILGCLKAYINIALRIGLYLSALSISAVLSYLQNREDPKIRESKLFCVILVKLALKLCTCSSCLATFADIAYPEEPFFRYTYLVFTLITGLSAIITYYETFLKLVEVIRGCVHECKSLHNRLDHFTFWPSLFSNLALLGMNTFILHKYFQVDGFNSSGVSLVLNVISIVFAVFVYVMTGVFCGHGPLCKHVRIFN